MDKIINIMCLFLFLVHICGANVQAREKKWKVKSVEFQGNETFKRVILLSNMELKPPVLFSSNVFTEYKLRSDISSIERFYRSQGFLNVKVNKGEVLRDSLKYRVALSIIINEGKQFMVNSVTIKTDNKLSDSVLVKSLRTRIDKPLIAALIDEDVSNIKERFAKEGYLKVAVIPDMVIDTLKNSANVILEILDGPVVYIDSINIKGNKGLNDRVIRRELEFRNGQKLTIDKVRKSERRLYRTNLFSYVIIEPVLYDSVNRLLSGIDTIVPVKVDVDETDFYKVEAGAGYGTADGIRGSLTTSYGNLFGLGHKITLLGNISQKLQEIGSRYSVPWFLTLPLKFDIALYIKNHTDEKNTFDALIRGLELTAGQQTDFNFAYRLWVKWEDVSRLSWDRNVKNTQSIGTDLVWDTRSDLINPVNGYYNEIQIETAGLTDKRSSEYIKITSDSRLYWKTGKIKLASGYRLGWSKTFGATDSLPLQERFFGGGSRSIRGFDEGELRNVNGKNLSGTTSLIGNLLEIRYPLFWWFEAALFADAGYIWISEQGENLTINSLLDNIRWTSGVGIRLNTPIAVIRMDVGFKLDKRTEEDRARLHFDIGNSF